MKTAYNTNQSNMFVKTKYKAPSAWVDGMELESMLLTISASDGEDLTTEELDPWSVGN